MMELWVTIIFLKFQNFPLDILFLYSEGEKKPIKSIGSVSHRYWFSYWAKGSFTAWETLIFPLCITPQEKKCVSAFLFMGTGQDGAPLNLSGDNDHYLLGDLEWVEIQ